MVGGFEEEETGGYAVSRSAQFASWCGSSRGLGEEYEVGRDLLIAVRLKS